MPPAVFGQASLSHTNHLIEFYRKLNFGLG